MRTTYPWRIEIGDRAWIGDFVELYTLDRVSIGEDAVVSQFTRLVTCTHDFEKPAFDMVTRPIVVEKQPRVSANCFVAPGVTVKRGAVVLACSLVLKDVPKMMAVAGQPAAVKRHRLSKS